MNKKNKTIFRMKPGHALGIIALLLTAFTTKLTAQLPPGYEWALGIGGKAYDYSGVKIVVDKQGNSYITGYFNDTVDFDRGPGKEELVAISPGGDLFIAKYDPQGKYLWAQHIGSKEIPTIGYGNINVYGAGIGVDAEDNVYVFGEFNGKVDFNPGADSSIRIAQLWDVFLTKYTADGDFLWAKSMGGPQHDRAASLAVDAKGNCYVTGTFNGTANFDPAGGTGGQLTQSGQNEDAFFAKYDKDGKYIWAKSINGKGQVPARDITFDINGNIYVSGYFSDDTDFNPSGGGNVLSVTRNLTNGYVAKYDSLGKYIWAINMGRTTEGIGVDTLGNVYATGYFETTSEFDPIGGSRLLTVQGFSDAYLAKYNAKGENIWAKAIGGKGYDYGTVVTVDRTGQVLLSGTFRDTVDFNPGGTPAQLISTYGTTSFVADIYMAKYNSAGDNVWAIRSAAGAGTKSIRGATIDVMGNIYSVGTFNNLVDFNPYNAVDTLRGYYDFFIQKLSCSDTTSEVKTVSACGEYLLNDSVYTTSGNYIQYTTNDKGCKHTIFLELEVIKDLDVTITVDSLKLGTNQAYKSYQWLKDGVLMPGANDSILNVTENGNYQVIVTNDIGCTDTSAAYPVNNAPGSHVNDIDAIVKNTGIYPNPAKDIVNIISPVPVQITISSVDGKVLLQEKKNKHITLGNLTPGVYLLHIADSEGHTLKVQKLVKY